MVGYLRLNPVVQIATLLLCKLMNHVSCVTLEAILVGNTTTTYSYAVVHAMFALAAPNYELASVRPFALRPADTGSSTIRSSGAKRYRDISSCRSASSRRARSTSICNYREREVM